MPESPSYRFFSNSDCRYFPCHAGADPSRFNCLFCYCPLYLLGDACGGHFTFTEKKHIKDCTHCLLPHTPEYYDVVLEKLKAAGGSGGSGSGAAHGNQFSKSKKVNRIEEWKNTI